MSDNIDTESGDDPHPTRFGLVVPFLDALPTYAYGVEFGMWYAAVSALGPGEEHAAYIRTENSEQMRLTCYRKGWKVVELKPWDDGPPDNGWVFLRVRKRKGEG